MSLRRKIMAISVLPVILLGIISLFLTVVFVKNSMIEEIQESLKGTAAATLAAYDQNAGDYMQASNGNIWKGSYNISKSENLVDKIKANSGMDVTFFYGEKRIMTSAVDANGERILGSPAGEKITEKVILNGEEYFSKAVSLDGIINYGYYIPVYQNNTTENPIGMIFVGVNKEEKDAAINQIIGMVVVAVFAVMFFCMIISLRVATKISKNLKSSIEVVKTVAEGNLNVWVDEKLIQQKDEVGELSRVMVTLRDAMKSTIREISKNAKHLQEASDILGVAARDTNGTMRDVKQAVNMIAESSTEQARNSQNTSENMFVMGENITETSNEVEMLNQNAEFMQQSSEKASHTIEQLQKINDEVEKAIMLVQEQTNRTNESVQKIHEATEFITAIAEETNLLSLNAAIEAARAGESGRGFAVVADQIQKLAEQSNKSSQEIEDITNHLMADSASAVETMQQMQGIIFSQNESMQDTQNIVKEVLEGITSSLRSIELIRNSTKRLESSRNEVVQSVEELSEIAQKNANSTRQTYGDTENVAGTFEQISDSAGQLRMIADELVESIAYFKLEA